MATQGSADRAGEAASGDATGARAVDEFGVLAEHALDLVSIYDANGRFAYASPSHKSALGFEPEELIGRRAVSLLHPDDRDEVGRAFAQQLLVTGVHEPVAHRVRRKDGTWIWVESIAADLRDHPKVRGILVNARDVTDRQHAETLAADQSNVLELIARGAPLDEVLLRIARMVEGWAPGAHGMVGVVDDGTKALRFVATNDVAPEGLAAIQGLPVAPDWPTSDGSEIVVSHIHTAGLRAQGYQSYWARVVRSERAQPLGTVIVLRCDDNRPDATDGRRLALAANLAALAMERSRAQTRLAHQATHDALTGLPNRETILQRLRHVTERRHHDGPNTALLFLDIDRFKVLNDSVGHEAGDRLLVELGDRLRQALRPGDLVARFGGDEFVMVCERVGGELDAHALATRILELVQEPFEIGGNEVVVTASVGIAMVDGAQPESLMRDADAAMYWAKDRGRARVELFDDELRDRVVDRLDIERALRQAVEHGDLVLHYQPIVALDSGQLVGFESLLRWPHPTRGLLTPEVFLEVAEETGLARPIGAWVREEACRQVARWRVEHPEWGSLAMGVNLTSAEMHERDLASAIERSIATHGIEPNTLVLEISERFITDDLDGTRRLLERLRERGVSLGLDDFGTGAAALVHLKELPIDLIKIDRAFVAGLGIDPFDDAIVEAILGLTTRLGLHTVAEGIETEEQAARLRDAGCVFAQGHRFAPAMSAAEVEAHLGRADTRITLAAPTVA